ncbi:MAG: hypothetical protein LBV75_02775, partial [Paludibacter sp.]|nr:hypothetical protein [Paludibacter sp.]
MKKILIAFLLVLFTLPTFAQVGYLGKRVVINADANFAPVLLSTSMLSDGFRVGYMLNPNIEFILGEHFSLGAGYLFTNGAESYSSYDDNDNYVTVANNYFAHGAGLSAKFYLKDEHAPFGTFLKLEGNYLVAKYMDNSLPFAGGRIEYGKDYLFFNCLRLSSGVSVGLMRPIAHNSDDIDSDIISRFFFDYLVSFRIGVGF